MAEKNLYINLVEVTECDVIVKSHMPDHEPYYIAVPEAEDVLSFSGLSQSAPLSADPAEVLLLNASATSAGIHAATARLANPAETAWEDGTTEDKTVEWEISQSEGGISLPVDSVELTLESPAAALSFEAKGDGVVVAGSSNPDALEVSVERGALYVRLRKNTIGDAEVILEQMETANTTGSYCTLQVHMDALELAPWSSGTDEQVGLLLEAHRNGFVNLTELWAPGQERKVKIGGSEEILVILGEWGDGSLAIGTVGSVFKGTFRDAADFCSDHAQDLLPEYLSEYVFTSVLADRSEVFGDSAWEWYQNPLNRARPFGWWVAPVPGEEDAWKCYDGELTRASGTEALDAPCAFIF